MATIWLTLQCESAIFQRRVIFTIANYPIPLLKQVQSVTATDMTKFQTRHFLYVE